MFYIDINCMETPIFKPEKGPKSEENDPVVRMLHGYRPASWKFQNRRPTVLDHTVKFAKQ